MLGNLLIAGGVTLPYWIFQKTTNKPVERSKVYRSRVFTSIFGVLTGLEVVFLLFLLSGVSTKDADAGGAIGRNMALPTIVLVSGLATKKGWMREPFKKFEPTVEN